MKRSNKGFTLIELMIVVVIIGILSALAIPRFFRAATKAKQSEAREVLKQVYTMQRAYFVEHETYILNGATADAGNTTAFALIAIELMPSARYSFAMVAAANTFSCTATSNLDDDAAIDTWTIDQTGALTNTIDDSVL
ncbi:MAG: prepilin-type N-terminal cleavage/methylation domain-containing protein [candidate division Zixibacteria bacterium]|nr:prepilin-type N-terminal cleavage/methylation domain-containing protein [candidate division Zixibacteria bacterium]